MTTKRVNNEQVTADTTKENTRQTPKAKPLRLRASLYQTAAQHAEREHRSIPKQIEYWAEIGRWIASKIDDQKIYALLAKTATINIQMLPSKVVSVEQAHRSLEQARNSGAISSAIQSELIYDTDPSYPDFIRETTADGTERYGEFIDGEFVAVDLTVNSSQRSKQPS